MPHLNPGTYLVSATVGGATATTAFTVTTLNAPSVVEGDPVVEAMAPLLGNLLEVRYFDAATQSWKCYFPGTPVGPGPAIDSLSELIPFEVYWIMLREEQSAVLGGVIYELAAGQNLIVWEPVQDS